MTLDEKLSFKWDFDFKPSNSSDIRSNDMALSQDWRLHRPRYTAPQCPDCPVFLPLLEVALWQKPNRVLAIVFPFSVLVELWANHVSAAHLFIESKNGPLSSDQVPWGQQEPLELPAPFEDIVCLHRDNRFCGTLCCFVFDGNYFYFVCMFCLMYVCMSTACACIPTACERPKEGTSAPGIVGMDSGE